MGVHSDSASTSADRTSLLEARIVELEAALAAQARHIATLEQRESCLQIIKQTLPANQQQIDQIRDNACDLLDTIFACAPIGLGVLDTNLRYIRVNQALADIDGIPISAYLGHTPTELQPRLNPTLEPIFHQVLSTGVAVCDLELHGFTATQPYEPRDWLANYYPIYAADGSIRSIGVIIVDITERTRTRAALQRQAELLQAQAALFDNAHVLVRDIDSRIISWNRGAESLYGWTYAEAIGRISHELLQTYFPNSFEAYQATLFSTGIWEGELIHTRRDGSQVIVASHQVVLRNQQGSPLRILEVDNDITALRRAEQALRERDEQLRLAYDAALLGTWRHIMANGIVELDQRAQAHHGINSSAVPIRDLIARVHPDDRARLEQEVMLTMSPAGDSRYMTEYRVIHPDGSIHWLAIHTRAYFTDEGSTRRPVLAGGTSQDITARKAIEEQVLASRARLQAVSERLIAVQEEERHHLARELHDEIGQSLTGLSLVLAMAPSLPQAQLQIQLAEAQRQVSNLITQVRHRSLDLRPSMLDDLGLHPALSWYLNRYTDQTGIKLYVQLQGINQRFPPMIELTAYRIVQEALTNVARHANVRQASVAVWVVNQQLVITVTDAGCGFNVEAAHSARASSGLTGMHERAALIGGELTIDSEPGAGTRLLANLPTVWPVTAAEERL
ncbi:MAG: PAS domain-containing protein [Oscillochloris sp.]|nr:PAS domain-containing protein [Oscillochloris sp.]